MVWQNIQKESDISGMKVWCYYLAGFYGVIVSNNLEHLNIQ